MRFLSLVGLVVSVASTAAAAAKAGKGPACLASGDEAAINEAFAQGGKGTTVSLCPGSVHRLSAPIYLTAPSQTLTTLGSAKGRDRAMLIVEGAEMAVAVFADCKQCSWATISNLIIDGNRPQLLRVPLGGALIEIGNGEGQKVIGCRLYEPRGWSALHVREGDSRNCRKAYVADNEVGPCGEEWDDEYDGIVERDPTFGNPRADGISVACKDSVVERNIVFDATDGAIVLFGSAGTVVRENDIYSRTRVVLGGINLVDYDPWDGDYTNVRVHHNRLWAHGRFFKVGIVVGPSSWSDDTDTIVYGGSVTDNMFSGQHFGYALVVSSAEGFTVARNKVAEDAKFIGVPGPSCPTAPPNGPPTAFLINRHSAKGAFQSEFENGEVQHIICIEMPPDANGEGYRPWRFRDSPDAVAVKDAEDPHIGASLEGRLADALVGYQANLLLAIRDVEERMQQRVRAVEEHSLPGRARDGAKDPGGGGGGDSHGTDPDSARVDERIRALEDGGARIARELSLIARELDIVAAQIKERADLDRPILEDVYKSVKAAKAASVPPRAPLADPEGRPSMSATSAGCLSDAVAAHGTLLVVCGAVLALALVLAKWRPRRIVKAKGI